VKRPILDDFEGDFGMFALALDVYVTILEDRIEELEKQAVADSYARENYEQEARDNFGNEWR
jgi:hypothetical protein